MNTGVKHVIRDLNKSDIQKLLKKSKEMKNALAKCFLKNNDNYSSFEEFFLYLQRKRVPARKDWNELYSLTDSDIQTSDFDGAEWLNIEVVRNLNWLCGDRLEYLFERMAFEPFSYSTDEENEMFLSVSESECKPFYDGVNEKCLNCAYIYDDQGNTIGKLKALHALDTFLIGIPKEVPLIINENIDKTVKFRDEPVPFTNGTLFLINDHVVHQ
ncbi:hypothetical protein ES703_114539 [subsurface metagenome]